MYTADGYSPYVHVHGVFGLIAGYSDSDVIAELIIGAVFAVAGYLGSERFRRRRGVTPWRLPSGAWAVVLFFFSLIGLLLYLIACSTTRPRAGGADSPEGVPPWGADPRNAGAPPPGGLNMPPPGGWNVPPSGGWNIPPPSGWEAQAPQGWDDPPAGGWGHPGGEAPPQVQPQEGQAPPPGGWNAPPPPGTVFPTLTTQGGPGAVPAPPMAPPPPPPPPRSWLPDPKGHHELRYWDGTKFTEHVADDGKITVDPL